MPSETPLSPGRVILWILILAVLSVGARNFELGMGADGPLYSTIARNIARTGEWFVLNGQVPEFHRFAEHPHLGFWLMALIFKVVPAADWSARIYGHVFYIAILCLLFFQIRRLDSEKAAALAVVTLWSWSRFSNPFSNVYLDPGALFFGLSAVFLWQSALEKKGLARSALAGLSAALCVAIKGMFFAGFLPVLAVCLAYRIRRDNLVARLYQVAAMGLVFAVCLTAYYEAVRHSHMPEFFAIYWERQMTERFERIWTLRRLFSAGPWLWILSVTYYTALLAFVPVVRHFRQLSVVIPLTLTISFLLAYVPNGLGGGQYLLPLGVGIGWLVGKALADFIPWKPATIRTATASFSLAAICVLQYLPIATHGLHPTPDESLVGELHRTHGVRRIWLDKQPDCFFIRSSRYAWWGDVDVSYLDSGEKTPDASADSAYVIMRAGDWERRHQELTQRGWCLLHQQSERSVWAICPSKASLTR